MIAKVIIYVYLKFGVNWHWRYYKVHLSNSFSCCSCSLVLKFYIQVGSNAPACSDLSKCCKQCSLHVHNKDPPIIQYHYDRTIAALLQIRLSLVGIGMTILLRPSTTSMFSHVNDMFVSNNKHPQQLFLQHPSRHDYKIII